MKTLSRLLLAAILVMSVAGAEFARSSSWDTSPVTEEVITFRFVPGNDWFYIPWKGNDKQLEALYELVDEYRAEIAEGSMPVYVDGYSASMRNRRRNLDLAFIRANRVKSELITLKGLVEDNFITKNYTTAYTGPDGVSHKDMVVVTLRVMPKKVSQPPMQPDPAPVPKPEPTPPTSPTPHPAPSPSPAQHPEPEPSSVEDRASSPTSLKPCRFAIRTNLLYDVSFTPTLGVEWRASRNMGIKLDGSFAWWGDEKGKVQKIWLVNPEVRWYMGDMKCFYLGAGANFGEYDIYKGMLGSLIPNNTGYQGKLWNAGLTVGYQCHLSRSFSLDLNLGLGYTNIEYDSFNMVGQVRVYKAKGVTKKIWGPTQAGINLVWTIGGYK